MIRLKAITTNILLEEIAKIYRDNIWKMPKVSEKILTEYLSLSHDLQKIYAKY